MFALVEALKAMLTNVDRAPILLSPVSWQRPFLPQDELLARYTCFGMFVCGLAALFFVCGVGA